MNILRKVSVPLKIIVSATILSAVIVIFGFVADGETHALTFGIQSAEAALACPNAEEIQYCMITEYMRDRKITNNEELDEMISSYKEEYGKKPKCPKNRRILEQCVLEASFERYDMVFGSPVLETLADARAKGRDAAIKSTLNSMRAQAELHYDNASSYKGYCASAGSYGAQNMIDQAKSYESKVDCNDTTGAWAIAAQLSSDTKQYYCVDSTGMAKTLKGTVGGTKKQDFKSSATMCPVIQ